MEAIFQFVDEVVEAQRDTYCAIADDIWDHPRPALRSSGQPNGWPTPEGKVFSSPAMLAGSRMPLSPASVRANRSLPCSANLTPPGGTQPAGPQRGTDALDTGSQRPRLWAHLLGTAAFAAAVAAKGLQQHGDSGTLRFYGCPGEEGGSGKPLWCAKGCLMMSMRR